MLVSYALILSLENVMNLQVDVDKDVKLVLVSLSAKEQKQQAFLAKQVRYSSPQKVIMDCNIPEGMQVLGRLITLSSLFY